MIDITKNLPENIILKNTKNPLSAVDKWNERPVFKFSYNPKTGKLLYSYPGDNHAVAIAQAGDTSRYDDYVRIIYDVNKNIGGSRIWGSANYEREDPDAGVKSFNAQYNAFKFFKGFSPGIKWIMNLTNEDLDKGIESLNLSKIKKNRILEACQIEAMNKKINNIYEDKTIDIMLEFFQGKK